MIQAIRHCTEHWHTIRTLPFGARPSRRVSPRQVGKDRVGDPSFGSHHLKPPVSNSKVLLYFHLLSFCLPSYVTEGKDILSQLRTGDVIQSARLVSGSDRLVVPGSESSAAEEEAEAVVVSES